MLTTRYRFFLTASLLIGSVLGLSSCYENTNATSTAPIPPAQKPVVQLTAVINGASEKPTSVTSAGAGTFAGVIDPNSRVFSYTVNYSGLTPSGGHLHRISQANGTGPVMVPFPTASLASPIIGSYTIPQQSQLDSITGGFWYVNLHTAANPAGEIRGDIKVK